MTEIRKSDFINPCQPSALRKPLVHASVQLFVQSLFAFHMSALSEAAAALEKRLCVLNVPRDNLEMTAWDEYEARFPGVVPTWFKEFLRDFAFMDVYLELPTYESYGNPWTKFSFRSPHQDTFCIEDDEEIVPSGWFPFAEEKDGNLWAMRCNARYQRLKPDGFVDLSRSGFMLRGDHDAYMEQHGIETTSELLQRTLRSSEPPPSLSS